MEQQNYPSFDDLKPQSPEFYLDVDQAADLLCVSRAELIARIERGMVPAHKLRHGKRFCWKFKPSELLEFQCDDLDETGATIQ